MRRSIKIILYSLAVLGVIFLITSIFANTIVKNKLEDFISHSLPPNMITSYDELSVHTLDGSVYFKNPTLVIQNIEDGVKHTFINAENLKITDLSYWDYIFKKKIHIGKIILENPTTTYYKDRVIPIQDSTNQETKIKKPIFVDRLQLNHTKLAIYENGKDSTKLYTQNFSFEINGIEVNAETINRKIPFEYKEVLAKGDSIFVKANPYDNLSIKSFSIENKNIVLNELRYYTKYSRAELSRIIPVEQDHYDLTINSVEVADFDFGLKKDTVFFAKSKKISINTPSLDIYRDKLVTDDPSIKPLYSRSLRELTFDLTVDSVKINEAYLKYEEKVHKENSGGHIQFKNLNADISNLSNTYESPEKTDIKIKAHFMDNTPLSIDWSFDVQNPQDQFVFKANVETLEAEKMNRFTEPNLKVRLEGKANKTYFTVYGNDDNSRTDLKIHYSDFRVTVLKKDGKKKNKFLSTVANILVSKDSEKKDEKFKEGTGEATRDKTKSVFNFLWISVKSGLQKTIM